MKRYGNLYEQICSLENLSIAFDKATRHKKWRNNIKKCIEHKQEIIANIRTKLLNKTYHTSQYRTKTIYEPKERLIYILPFAPDRIVHHAIMHVIEPILDKKLIYDTYSCRIGKGQMKASNRCLSYCCRYKYCLQLDISKFYPSIHHQTLKQILRTIFKDKDLLWLLDEIIDSPNSDTNVPIGNYLSQWFGNIYLNTLDRFCLRLGFTKVIRYCDDMLIFSNNKSELISLVPKIRILLAQALRLKLSKARIIKTTKGIQFLGFRHYSNSYRGYLLLKRKTKIRITHRLLKLPDILHKNSTYFQTAQGQLASAIGWLSHANCYNLSCSIKLGYLCKILGVYTDILVTMNNLENILEPEDRLGIFIPMEILLDKPCIFYQAALFKKDKTEYLRLVYSLLGSKQNKIYVSFTKSSVLKAVFNKYKKYLPFDGKIVKVANWYNLVPSSWRKETMKGFPSHLNTKEDYLYIKQNFEPELWKPEFQKLLDSIQDWFFVKDLASESEGITDDTHKVVSSNDSESDKPITYAQYELKDNPNAKIFELGFTKEEIEGYLA